MSTEGEDGKTPPILAKAGCFSLAGRGLSYRLFPDRFWWFSALIGVLVALVNLITLAGVFAIVVQIGLARINFPWVALPGWVFLGATSFFCFRHAFHSRDHFCRRLRAMRGEQEVMLRADISTAPDLAPDLATGSIELIWRATPIGQRAAITGLILLSLVLGGSFVLGIYLFLLTFTRPQGLIAEMFLRLLIAGVIAVLSLVGMAYYTPKLLAYRGSPNGVKACPTGLLYYPKVGHGQVIQWEDLHLFEVAFDDVQNGRLYRLYGTNAIAEWGDGIRSNKIISLGMPDQEFLLRHQTLLNLIVARTHLLPRTFDPRLALKNEPPIPPVNAERR